MDDPGAQGGNGSSAEATSGGGDGGCIFVGDIHGPLLAKSDNMLTSPGFDLSLLD